jgi:hypothetical protein
MSLVDHLGARLVMCPASSRKQYHAAYPGGLVEHSLHVFANARKLVGLYELDVPLQSLIISCLFHDIGKVGDLDKDYYVEQTNNWRVENYGEVYFTNPNIQWMPSSERGLWLLQHFGVKLSNDEWIAIRCNDGMYTDENRPYAMKEPRLALVVHHADRIACEQEKIADLQDT